MSTPNENPVIRRLQSKVNSQVKEAAKTKGVPQSYCLLKELTTLVAYDRRA